MDFSNFYIGEIMRLSTTFPVLLTATFILTGCGGTASQQAKDQKFLQADIAIVDVNVLTMTDDKVLEHQTVLIADGKVLAVEAADDTEVSPNTKIITGKGKYLLPGLAEMHAHIPVPREGNEELTEETLFLYLSNGVTTIRGMLGHPLHLELKESVAREEVLSPRIYTSGPSLNGNTVPDTETADSTVRAQKAAGYDFMKLHPGLKREVFDEIVATAKEVGIPYAGHVSVDVGIRHALASDYASVDHIDGYLEGLVPESAGVNPNENGFFGFNFTDLADESLIGELVSLTLEHNVAVVPTQGLLVRWTSTDKPEVTISEPEMKYMSPRTRENWESSKFAFQGLANYTPERVEKFISIRKKLLKAMQDKGVLLLLGSDAPQVFNVPGFSIHHELSAMIDAGLTPYECLVAGTVNPARYFNMEGEFGQITEGASADLLLVDGNPLENLSHLRDPSGVMVRGRWLSAEEIDNRLADIEKKYRE